MNEAQQEKQYQRSENPEDYPGSPQAAAAQALKTPRNGDDIRKGNRKRTREGIGFETPCDYGGIMFYRPTTVRSVQSASEQREREMKAIGWIKQYLKANDNNWPAYARYELIRIKVIMSLRKWDLKEGIVFDGETYYPSRMYEKDLHSFVSQWILPPIDLTKPRKDLDPEDLEDDDELDWGFLFESWDICATQVSQVPAVEIAAVGEPYIVGHTNRHTETD